MDLHKLERDLIDPLGEAEKSELRNLAFERGYKVAYEGDVIFLLWPEKKQPWYDPLPLMKELEQRGVHIETVFPPFRTFDYSKAVFQFDKLEDPWSLTLAVSPKATFLSGRMWFLLKHGRFLEVYKQIIERHELEKHKLADKVPILASIRDVLEKQIWRNGEIIQGFAGYVESILQVWICEGSLCHGPDDLNTGPLELALDAETIRDRILTGSAGFKLARCIDAKYAMDGDIDVQLFRHTAPDVLKKAQSAGLLVYAQQIEKIVDYSVELNLKRLAYETIIHAAMLDLPLSGVTGKPPRLHGNSIWSPFKKEIATLWIEVKRDRSMYKTDMKLFNYVFISRYDRVINPKIEKYYGYDPGRPSYSTVRGYARYFESK